MDHYFDRLGRPISLASWAELQGDQRYKFLADEIIGGYRIATIWTGMDPYRFDPTTAPLIFESTVFIAGTYEVVEQVQHTTEADAITGQAAFVLFAKRMAAHGGLS